MAVDKAKILQLADKLIAKQNYNKALNELLKVLKASPADVNLLNKIGDLYNKLGKEEKAISYFLKVAESYQRNGFNLKAIALYKKVIRINAKYMDARHRLVELYIQQGYHSETKGELSRMAEHYYSENLFSRALDCYEKMAAIDPSNLDARIKITELLVREGKRDEATRHFVIMARELLDKSMLKEAKRIISQGLKLASNHPELLVLLSRTLLAEGKEEDALTQLTELNQEDSDNLDVLNLLGQIYLSRDQVDKAKEKYLKAFALAKGDPGPLEDVSRCLLKAGRLDEAFEALKPIGEMFLEQDKHEEATRLFRSVIYSDANHIPSQEMLVRIYRKSQQTDNALLTLEKVAHHYLDRGDHTLACLRIEEILELDANNQQWRSKLNELKGSAVDLEDDEIHVFDESAGDVTLSDDSVDLANQGESARLANHLTEANIFIKYGTLDEALEHLEAAKDLDFLNEEVNSKIKDIYLKKGDVNKAIPCMVSLVNASLEQGNVARALERVDEIGKYNQEVASIHRSRIETIAGGSVEAPAEGFDLDFSDAVTPADPTSDLMLAASPADQEVMDFRKMPPPKSMTFDLGSTGNSAWSLDMPAEQGTDKAGGVAEDFRDLYDPSKLAGDQAGATELPELSELADDSRLDLSIEELTESKDGSASIDSAGLADDRLEIELSIDDHAAKAPEEMSAPTTESEAKPSTNDASSGEAGHAPLGAAQGESLASELEEIDFFISVEAYEDARNLIADALQQFGEHPLLMERQHEVDAKTQSVQPTGSASSLMSSTDANSENLPKSEEGLFDLAAELSEELFEEEPEVNDATAQEEIQSVDELFEEFKKGVDEQIEEGDFETHYDLGIAYKEMGLLEEAINEFEKARKDTNRFLECAIMIGNCLTELGRTEKVVNHYECQLAVENMPIEASIPLYYELALAYQSAGELEKALAQLRKIQADDPHYRDVAHLIEALV